MLVGHMLVDIGQCPGQWIVKSGSSHTQSSSTDCLHLTETVEVQPPPEEVAISVRFLYSAEGVKTFIISMVQKISLSIWARRDWQKLMLLLLPFMLLQCTSEHRGILELEEGVRIAIIGNNLGYRMMKSGHFETALHLRHPEHQLFIRNMSRPGNTPGFRPHSSRDSAWAFPGADQFYPEFAGYSGSEGHFPAPDEWLDRLDPDHILALFGYSESFAGEEGLNRYKGELDAFVRHMKSRHGVGPDSSKELVLISPIAFEDLSEMYDLPDGRLENENLALYTEVMREVAREHDIAFIDLFSPTQNWFSTASEPMTLDGAQLTEEGYRRLATLLADELAGRRSQVDEAEREAVNAAVRDKNWMWHQDYMIPNGVHAYGRRFNPFGPDNYPAEVEKIREMTAVRDTAIWRAVRGETMDVAAADRQTRTLPPVETNYDPAHHGDSRYLYGEEALDQLTTAPGYKVELFASEEEFEDLANPVQITFDNQGRLWVATMPSYPHYRPGDTRPDDKLIILEDTDGDGKADRQTVFADGLHLPVGFMLTEEGVYVSQGPDLVLLKDTDGDDQADSREVILSGFDDHDTHHAHSTYTMDPSGAFYMAEGVFLHSNIETPYGPVRSTNGGFFRYSPQRNHLERTAQLSIPNPWGIVFDEWGTDFFAETSGPDVLCVLPGKLRSEYGVATPKSVDLIEDAHRVRPTSGFEIVSSRHFPDEVQGDLLIYNTIGFLGMKQHTLEESETGFRSVHRQDLLPGSDRNFRPVDMEFAPDGSLYLADWHNVLIGHMQHNARDPLRDHVHGRIYRITYPSRPLVEPAEIAGAEIDVLLDNLKLPEFRTRERTRRELRGRDAGDVLPKLRAWVTALDDSDERYEHHLLEALWVSWGLNQAEESLLRQLLGAEDHRARAAAVRVLRYTGHQVEEPLGLLLQAAGDDHGRVRLEAIVAASWLEREEGLAVLGVAGQHPVDDWMRSAYETARARLSGEGVVEEGVEEVETTLSGRDRELYIRGHELYIQDGYCGTCHQPDGGGLAAAGFPPLDGTKWGTGSPERLIKLTLHGLSGPIEVKGESYPGAVPMTPFGGLLDDEEIAAVLTYVRNSFGNEASVVTAEQVSRVREAVKQRDFYTPEELLAEHPLEE